MMPVCTILFEMLRSRGYSISLLIWVTLQLMWVILYQVCFFLICICCKVKLNHLKFICRFLNWMDYAKGSLRIQRPLIAPSC